MIDQFKIAKNRSVPLIGIKTSDPADTIRKITSAYPDQFYPEPPLSITWDISSGMECSDRRFKNLDIDPTETQNPTECLVMAQKLPPKSILFMLFGHMYFESESYISAMWKLRDIFKQNNRQLVLLGSYFKLPSELSNDFLLLDDPLPNEAELRDAVNKVEASAKVSNKDFSLDDGVKDRIASSLSGLSGFSAEQSLYMALNREGIDLDLLSERKRMVAQQSGATIHKGPERFDSVAGNSAVISLMKGELKGRRPPLVIAYMDEIEKMIGTDMDTSGTSQAMKGLFLSWWEDNGVRGILNTGVPGTGKSLLYKATAGEAGIPGVGLNFSSLKGSLVGQSEQNLSKVLAMLQAIGRGEVFVIATANNIGILTPDIRSRFYATFFFDLPSQEERDALWKMYMDKYSLEGDIPESHNWVGREIRNCCDVAWRLNMSLTDAAKFIVPVSVSSAEVISRMREEANGRYLSASYEGHYQVETASERAQRSISL